MNDKKKRRRYGSSFWIDPATKLGYARVVVKLSDGKSKTITRRAINPTHAQQIADEIKTEYESRKEAYLDGRKMLFAQLAEWYEREFLIPPRYVDGKKIGGLRTFQNERNKLKKINVFFGETLLAEIDETMLRRFKHKRLDEGVSITTVNRDLETLRTMFRRAVRRKWIKESPFELGERLIEKSLESRRTVTVTDEQEKLLLAEARKLKRSRLYYLIIALLDTGARPSELYPVNEYEKNPDDSDDVSQMSFEPVRWCDFFEFDFEMVRLVSYKGRERKERFAPVSNRLKTALLELWEAQTEKDASTKVFPEKSFKTSWQKVRANAGVKNLRLRDFRRHFRTRLANKGFSDNLTQRLLGHEQLQMTYHYAEADLAVIRNAKQLLDE